MDTVSQAAKIFLGQNDCNLLLYLKLKKLTSASTFSKISGDNCSLAPSGCGPAKTSHQYPKQR